MSLAKIVALLSIVSFTSCHPLVERGVAYKMYSGDGTSWPSASKWVSFDTMWTSNQGIITGSCKQHNAPNNSPEETKAIHDAILAESKSSGVDSRFILATVLQESNGCVRVPTTSQGVRNPGLMQTHDGAGDCTGKSPCPPTMIATMIKDGASGTAKGAGLAKYFKEAKTGGASDAVAVYRAARFYNSGPNGLGGQSDLNKPTWGTSCYSTDIANRLMGWSDVKSGCTLASPVH